MYHERPRPISERYGFARAERKRARAEGATTTRLLGNDPEAVTGSGAVHEFVRHGAGHTVDWVDGLHAGVIQQGEACGWVHMLRVSVGSGSLISVGSINRTCKSKHRVPHVGDVLRAVRDAALVGVLRAQDERRQFLRIDPVGAVQDRERGERPPAVADLHGEDGTGESARERECERVWSGPGTHIFELFRSTIQASVGQLSLAQPPAEGVCVDDVEAVEDREGPERGPHCVGVPEWSVKVVSLP